MARNIALTGTPGTGKTSTALVLESKGHEAIDVNKLSADLDARTSYDDDRDTWEVDIGALKEHIEKLASEGAFSLIEGHLAHLLDVDAIIVLRAHPETVRSRLLERGYGPEKIKENVWAEALGVIHSESIEIGVPVFQINTTDLTPDGTAERVLSILDDEGTGEEVDWSEWINENGGT